MTQLLSTDNDIQAHATYITFASLGLMCCMVVTIVGIKIWWFKHRLSFEQSSTNNGAAGGSQPRVVARNRSSKDKRLSQQFREPVVVHGVFRKRDEDEMEALERPKQLPPVRPTKLSQSTPSLFRPPSALKEETDFEVVVVPTPPQRNPPAVPELNIRPMPPTTLQIQTSQTMPTAAPIPEITPIINTTSRAETKPAMQIETVELKEEKNTAWSELSDHHQTLLQAALTPISDNEEPLKIIAAAITVHQIQSPAVEQPPVALARNFTSDIIENEEIVSRRYIKAKPAFDTIKSAPNLMERRITGFHRPGENDWQQIENESDEEEEKYIPYDEWARNRNDLYFEDEFGKMELKVKAVQFKEDTRFEELNNETEKDSIIQQRRPTGYVRKNQQLDQEGDTQNEQEIWREMEKDIEAEFSGNIDEEFNKIRHTYEANEEGFLESPTGYGKSIDEDWESFENLGNEKENIKDKILHSVKDEKTNAEEWSLEKESKRETFQDEQRVVTFNVEVDGKEESKPSLLQSRRPTGFPRDKVIFDEQLWTNDEETTVNNKSILKVTNKSEDDKDEDDHNQCEGTLLFERRPTEFVFDSESLEISKNNARDSIVEIEHETKRQYKPRQKVTFQVHTVTHSPPQTPSDYEESDVDADASPSDSDVDVEELLSQEMPKPMKRMTNMRYTAETDIMEQPIPPPRITNSAALLFSTQVSSEYAESDENEFESSGGGGGGNDSWSAIRKHRDLTEEFQQITLESETNAILQRSTPKAAYRNPLAQMAINKSTMQTMSVEVDEEINDEYVRPRTMRDMKKAQTRRVESLQFESQAGTAEA